MSNPNAPYSGGFAPGAEIFAVDGDWSKIAPEGPPEIHFPFKGDSIVSTADVVLRIDADVPADAPLSFAYKAFPVGNRSNLQPYSANQQTFVIDQKFRVAAEFYQPMPLNTRYDAAWARPWLGTLESGLSLPGLAAAILVHEGATHDCGGGIFEVERQFATIPFTRNETEQFIIRRIGLRLGGTDIPRQPVPVMTRIQYDYFVWDETGILSDLPLFTDLTAAGIRLNSETGFRPAGMILDQMKFYGLNEFQEVETIYDADPADPTSQPSTPSLTDYESWMANGSGTSNGAPAEMVIEASTITRYQGNILERCTRFAEIQ